MGRTDFNTTPNWRATVLLSASMPFALAAGTGGQYTAEYLKQRELGLALDHPITDPPQEVQTPNAADDLSKVRSVLGLSVTDLANCLGVSRQAIYNWQAGAETKAANAAKLEGLNRAVETLESVQIRLTPILAARRLPGGQSLREVISSGGDVGQAVTVLVGMLRNESVRRAELAKRFVGRRPLDSHDDAPPVSDD